MVREVKTVDELEFKGIERELLERQAELLDRQERTHKHIYQKDEPVSANFNEQLKETENDQLVMALEADGIEELAQIARALQRIEAGDYLSCIVCGMEIGSDRLKAIPYTDRCIACAE